MRIKCIVIVFMIVSARMFASFVPVAQLPASAYADTEVVTNMPLSVVAQNGWRFKLDLSRAATSNSVQVAFGRDVNGDGVLSPEETTIVVGWNADRVFVENPASETCREESTPLSSRPHNMLALKVDLAPNGTPTGFRIVDENGAGYFADLANELPPWLFDPSWNLFQVTVRGTAAAAENLRISVAAEGTTVRLR